MMNKDEYIGLLTKTIHRTAGIRSNVNRPVYQKDGPIATLSHSEFKLIQKSAKSLSAFLTVYYFLYPLV